MDNKVGRLVPDNFPRWEAGLFGFYEGQIRVDDLVHNGSWFNAKGQKICWGDLSARDMATLRDSLMDGEVFVVVSENDSYWSFHPKFGDPKFNGLDMNSPGSEYVAAKAQFIIVKGVVYSTRGSGTYKGLELTGITRDHARKLIID